MKPVPVSAQMSLQRAQHSVVLEEPYRIGLDMLRSIMSFIQMFTHTNTLSLHNGCMQEAGTSGTKKNLPRLVTLILLPSEAYSAILKTKTLRDSSENTTYIRC